MTYPHKKHVILSSDMDHLKSKINEDKEKQKSFTETVHKGGKLARYLVEGLQNILGLVRPFFRAVEEVRILGFAFQMLSVIPNAVITLTDKNSSRIKKTFALLILLTTTGLGITAFTLGGVVAAGIGLAFASLATLFAGVSFIASLINKYQTSKAYKEKKEFIDLLHNRDIDSLDNDFYRERLEIRTLELEQLLEQSSDLSTEKEELEFINTIRCKTKYELPQVDNRFLRILNSVRRKMGLTELPPDDSPVTKLSKLYVKHKSYVVYLAAIIKVVDQKRGKEGDPLLIDLVSAIQHRIAKIDKDIERITEPLHQLEQNNHLADQTIVKSYTNLALGSVGVMLSTIGFILLLGTVAMPPFMGTVLLGFGIGLAVFGAIKWGVELYIKRENEKLKKERSEENEEIILEEALNSYDYDLSLISTSSYSTKLRPIFNLQAKTDPDEAKNSINTIESVNVIEIEEIIPTQAPSREHINPSINLPIF
jgi:hypothetical protein